jgi:hypothetical protein
MASKYNGSLPHQLPIDNGNYHGGTQDFRIGLQYNVRRRPATLTPFVTVVIPIRDYTFFAHSAVGTHQPELDLGLAVGGRFERWLPNAYYQATYSYGIVGVVKWGPAKPQPHESGRRILRRPAPCPQGSG